MLHVTVADGSLQTGVGPAPGEPDLVLTFDPDELPHLRLLLGDARDGKVELAGRSCW